MHNTSNIFVEQIKVGGDRNFAYIAADKQSGEACVIDPAYNPELVYHHVTQNNFILRYVFNTHGHTDHTNGNDKMYSLSGIRAAGYGTRLPESNIIIKDDVTLKLGRFDIKILHTPGHTPDSICIWIDDALFTGDTLFVGKVGGTDLGKQARQEYESLHQKILKLPDSTRIYPGHDYGVKPNSTILNEKRTNPFLIQSDFTAFVDLKKNWTRYKKEHGIE